MEKFQFPKKNNAFRLCRRKDCNFTFKNKCDIDKHKAYHMRDDAYTRQGFKKFYKNEACG